MLQIVGRGVNVDGDTHNGLRSIQEYILMTLLKTVFFSRTVKIVLQNTSFPVFSMERTKETIGDSNLKSNITAGICLRQGLSVLEVLVKWIRHILCKKLIISNHLLHLETQGLKKYTFFN